MPRLCVDFDDILVLLMIACCMITLLLLYCMLLVCVGHTSIPLSQIPWSRSTLSLLLLCLMFDWRLVAPCLLFNRASD